MTVVAFVAGLGLGWWATPVEVVTKTRTIPCERLPLVEHSPCADLNVSPVSIGDVVALQTTERICIDPVLLDGKSFLVMPVDRGVQVEFGEAVMFRTDEVVEMFANKSACAATAQKCIAQEQSYNRREE